MPFDDSSWWPCRNQRVPLPDPAPSRCHGSACAVGRPGADAVLALSREAAVTPNGLNRAFLVEQYKSSAGGTWSLNDLIEIAAGLCAAAPEALDERTHYRFVTDGRPGPGRLDAFFAFLAAARAAPAPVFLIHLAARLCRWPIVGSCAPAARCRYHQEPCSRVR